MPKKQSNHTDPANTPQADRPLARNAPAEVAAEQGAAEVAAAAPHAQGAETDLLGPLRAELEEARDRALRCQAELENYRKRATRELQEKLRYANLPLMRDLLPVLDNMHRAIEAAEKTHDDAGLLEGVKMVAQQLEDALGRHHCVRIEALNEPFDPNLHEAISQHRSDEHPDNTVTLVAQTGFQLHDRVVRPSQVIVSTATQQDE